MLVEASDDSSLNVGDTDSSPTGVRAVTDLASIVEDNDGLRRAVEASDVGVPKMAFLSSNEHVARSSTSYSSFGNKRAECLDNKHEGNVQLIMGAVNKRCLFFLYVSHLRHGSYHVKGSKFVGT